MDASMWVNRTARQRTQAVNRYDREAKQILARAGAKRDQAAREKHISRSRQHVDTLSPLLLRGCKRDGTPLTAEQITGGSEMLDAAWEHLIREGVVEPA